MTDKEVTYIITALNDIAGAMPQDHLNDHNNTVGDELHQIEHQLGRIADALEIIAKK